MRNIALAAVLLVAAVSAVPAVPPSRDAPKCAGYCKDGSKFKYKVGSTYTYAYTADTVTSVTGAGDESSRLHFYATVEIHALSQCDFTMQLRDVKLNDSVQDAMPRSSEFSSALERHPLSFSFQDGTVDGLCVTGTDPAWVVNIKRGVLSVFQNTMRDLHTDHRLFETDVTGVCETLYIVENTSETLTMVNKKKNLIACGHRMDHFLSLQSTPSSSESHTHTLPLVKSEHECLQKHESGLLIEAICLESHLFRPFSNGDNGAVTKVVQNLVYKHQALAKAPTTTGGATVRSTLLFQHTADEGTTDTRAHIIVSSLEELERNTRNGIQNDTPKVFSQLVATLRLTSYPTLAMVFSRTRQQHTRKFLLDAMPLVGTADGLTVMTDLYKSGEITDSEMDSWLTSLTFLKRPTITMLLSVASLLDGEPRPKAILGLSSLVHSYCQTDSECREKEPVQDYLTKMEKLLGDGCHVKGRNDMELKILALKGIGNMGVPPTSLDTIANCYMNPENALEVRLAAIGAHRRLPCASTWTTNLLQTYTDMQLDTELRIAAYLTVMQCPSAVILAKVKETLYSEEVNQVASFVWTHLTNIQETSSRWKLSIKELISSDFLQNKFHTDARKFSRNYEGSLFVKSLNVGVTVDSNVVFTPRSYLPRSASLNLTLDLFGESINVFEVGGRAEGFELIVEDMFGPRGYFPDGSLRKVLQNARARRDGDLENSIDRLAEVFDADGKLNVEPQASTYARVFGNEIHYSRHQGLMELSGGHSSLNNPLEVISKLLGGQDVDYTSSFIFLDASYRFPTAAGLPLELAVNGSATVGLKASGHLELSHGSVEVRGKVAPSAAVRVVGTMVVDGAVTKAGLRSVSVLHTNTNLEGQATVRGRNLVDVKVNMPREKVEVLEVTSKMFVLRREVDVEVAGVIEDKEASSGCSSEVLSQVTGMKLCGELAYPNASRKELAPNFPLTGPMTLRINLLKTDTFDSYILNLQQLSQADGEVRTLKLQFDTPNSQIDRRIETFLSLDKKNAALKGNLRTPFVRLDVAGKVDYNENAKAVDLTVRMNDATLFATKAAVKTSLSGQLRRYEPTMSMVIHNVVDFGFNGKVNFIEGTKYSADFTVTGLTNTPLLLAADLNCDGGKYDMAGSLQSPLVEGTVHANLRQTNSFVNTKVTAEYSVRGGRTESVNLSAKIQSGNKKAVQKNSVYASLQMSALPRYNLLVRWDRITGDNYAEYSGRFGLGKTEWQTRQMYRLHARGADDIDFSVVSHLACQAKDVDYRAEVQYKTTESSIATHVLAQLSQNHKFYSALNVQSLDERQEFSAELSSPWYMTSLKGNVVEREPGHFATQVEGRYEVVGPRGVSHVRSLAVHSTYIDGGTETRQEQKLSIELSGVWVATLSGQLISEAGSSNMWAQLDTQGNKYRADVTHAQNGVNNHIIHTTLLLVDRTYRSKVILTHTDVETAFSVDLQLSKRLVLSTKTFNDGVTQGVEFELFWDKDADPSRRISMMVHRNNVKREALIEFPGQYMKAELVTLPKRVSALLEWAEDQKIVANVEWNIEADGANGTARLTTPFPGIESQSMSVNYKYNAMVIQIETDLAWQDERITLAVTGTNKDAKQQVGDQMAVNKKYEVKTTITSTMKSIADISANYEHQLFLQKHSKSLSISYNKMTVFTSSLTSQPSELKADVYFDSPFTLVPSIHGNVSRTTVSEGHNHSLQMQIGLDKKTQFVIKQNSNITDVAQVYAAYVVFKDTNATLTYSNVDDVLNLIAVVKHSGKVTAIDVLRSETAELVLWRGSLKTPFTKPFEAGFTHSLKQGVLKEGISVSLDDQHMLLGSFVGTYHSLSDFKVTADVELPSHSLVTKLGNQVSATSIKTEFEGLWNGDRVACSLMVGNRELQLIATVSDLRAKREVQFVFSHTREPGTYYFTNLKLHDYLIFSHKLSIESVANWENTIYVKMSKNEGQVTNKHSYIRKDLDLSHSMQVDWNGPRATFNVALIMHDFWLLPVVKNAEGVLTTYWTRPITFVFNLPITKQSFNPQLTIKYQDSKEIIVESMIQFESMSVTGQLDVKSPFCKPIHVKSLFDISTPVKVALLTVEWEDKQVDLKSTVIVDNHMKATGVFLLTRSDMDGKFINAQFKYDTSQKEDMTGHLTVGYKGTELEVDLSGSSTNEMWKGNCEIKTPFSTWEKLTTSFNVDVSKPAKSGLLTMGRNNESVSMSASVQLSSPWELSLVFTSTAPSLPSISMKALLESNQVHREVKLSCDYGGQLAQLLATLNTEVDLAVAEVSMQTPFRGLEDLLGRASYVGKPGDKSMSITVRKNQWKVQVDANSMWKQNSTGEVSLNIQTPFEGLERLSGSLKHMLKTQPDRQITTDIVLTRNNERVEMASSVTSSLDGLSLNVQCKTPLDEYKIISGEFSIKRTPVDKSIHVSLVNNEERVIASAVLKMKDQWHAEANLQVTTPFQGFEELSAGFYYGLENSIIDDETARTVDGKVIIFLSVFDDTNEIEIGLNYLPSSYKSNVRATVKFPLLSVNNMNIEGKVDTKKQLLDLHGKVNDQFISLHAELLQNSLDTSILSSIDGYERLNFSSVFTMTAEKKVASVSFAKNDAEFLVSITAILDYFAPELHIVSNTPIKNWEKLNIDAKYDVSNPKKAAQFSVKKLEDKYTMEANWSRKEDEIMEFRLILNSPFDGFKTVNARFDYYLARGFSTKALLETDNYKIEGDIVASDKEIRFMLDTPLEQIKHFEVVGSYEFDDKTKSVAVRMERNEEQTQFDVKLSTTRDTSSIAINTPFSSCRSFLLVLNHNADNTALDLSVFKNSIILVDISGQVEDSQSRIGLYINASLPVISPKTLNLQTWYIPQLPERKVMFSLYRSGDMVAELQSIVSLAQEDGFDYVMEVHGGLFDYNRHTVKFEMHLKDSSVKSRFSLTNEGTEDRYSAQLVFDNTALKIAVSSPVEGYEDFLMHLNKSTDALAIEFHTSFFYYDTLKFTGQISNKNNYENFVSLSLVKGLEKLGVDWKLQYDSLFAKSSFDFASPFNVNENFNLKGEYDLRNYIKSLSFALDRNDHSVEINSMLALKGDLLADSSINVTTSFPDLRNIKLFGSVDMNNPSHKNVIFSAYLNDARQIGLSFDLESGTNKAKFALVSITPYYETSFRANGSYDFSEPSKIISVEGVVSVLDVIVNVSAVMVNNSKRGELHGTFIKAKIQHEGELSWILENEQKQKKVSVTVDLGGTKKVEFMAVVNMDESNNVKTLINLTDFDSHRYSLSADWSVVKETIQSKLGLQWNDKEIVLESLVACKDSHHSTNFKFTSPYSNFEEIIFQSKWTHGNSYEFATLLQWKKDKKVVLNVVHPVSQLQAKLETPYTSPISFSLKHLSTNSSSSIHSNVLASFHYGPWRNELNTTFEIGENVNLDLTLVTPIRGVKFLQMNGKFKSDVKESEALLSLVLEDQKWKFSGIVHRYENKSDLGVKVSTPLQSLKQGQLLASYDISSGYSALLLVRQNEDVLVNGTVSLLPSSAMFEVSTPWEGIRVLSAEYKLDVERDSSQLIARSNFEGKKSELEASFKVESDKILAEVHLKSPWNKNFSLHGLYNKKDTHTMKMTLRRGEQVTEMLGYLGYVAEDLKLEVEFESAVEGYGSLSAKAGYDWRNPLKTALFNARVGETEFHARAQGKVSRDGIIGDLHIDTPVDSLKLLEIKLQLEKTGSILMLIDDKKYQLNYITSFSADSIGGQVSVSSPRYQLKNAAFSVKYGKTFLNFNGEINDDKVDFVSSFQFNKLKSYLNSKLQAPFVDSLKHIELNFDLDTPKSVFSSSVQWRPTERINVESKLGAKDFRLKIETPFDNLRSIDVSSQIAIKNRVYNLLSRVDWDSLKMDFDGTVKMEPLDVSLDLQAEWGNGQTVSMRTALANKEEKIMVHTIGTVEGKQINIVGVIDKANLIAKLNVDIPFFDIVPMYAEARLTKDLWKTCDVGIRVSLPKVSYKATANYALTDADLKVGLDLDLPFITSSLVVGGSYSNDNFTEMETIVYINNNKVSASYEIVNNVLTGALDVNAPDLGISIKRIDVQSSLAFNPDVQASLTYRSVSYNGSIAGSLLKLNDGISVRIDLDWPQSLGPLTHTARMAVKYLGPQKFVEVRLDNGRSTRSAFLEINKSGPDMNIAGRISGPSVGEKEVTVALQNNLQSVIVNVFDILRIQMKNDIASGSAAVQYSGKEHKVLYQVSRNTNHFDASLALESELLRSGNVKLHISYVIKDKNVEALVKCDLGKFSNEAVIEFINQKKKSVSLKIVKDSRTFVKVSLSRKLKNNKLENEASLEWSNSVHAASIKYNPTRPIDVQILFTSPRLPHNLVEAKLTIQDNSLVAYAGIGNKALNQYVALNAHLNSDEKSASFEFQAPCCSLVKTLTFNGVFKVSKQNVHLLFEGHFSSETVSDSQLLTKFILSKNGVNASVIVQTPFLEFRHFESTVQVPFVFSTKQYDLNLLISLPSGIRYAAHAQIHNSGGTLEASAGAEYNAHKIGGSLKVLRDPTLVVDLKVDTPFKRFKHYQVQLRGQRSLADGDDIVNYVEWNGRRIELRHTTVSTETRFDYRVQLMTPFKNYERYVAGLQMEFDVHKKALAVLSFPGLESDWAIEFDFRLNDLIDSSFLVNVQMPIFAGFKSASLLVGSKYDVEKLSYRGVVSANYNKHEFITTLDGVFEKIGLKVDFNTQLDNNKVNAQFIGGFQDNGMVFSGFEIETPFAQLKSGKISLQMFPYKLQGLQANVNFNSVEILYVNVFEDKDRIKTIEVRNPWRSVSLSHSIYFGYPIKVWSEVCWDLNNKTTSRFGSGFIISDGKVSVTVNMPTRDLSLNYTRLHSSSAQEYATLLSWEAGQVLGYKVRFEHDSTLKRSALVRLVLPFRTFELSSHVNPVLAINGEMSAQFLWNADRDNSKTMGASLTWTPDNAELALHHVALKHSLTLRLEQENCLVVNAKQPRTLKLAFQYTPLPQDLLVLGVHYQDAWEDKTGVEIFFGVRHDASNIDHSVLLLALQTSEHRYATLGVNYKTFITGEKRTLEVYAKQRNDHPEIEVSLQDTNNKLSVGGSLWSKDDDSQGFTVELSMNQKEPLRVEGKVNLREASSELDVSYGDGRSYTLSAGMPTPRLVSAGIVHRIYGLASTDGEVTLRLNTSRLLWTRVLWQPHTVDLMRLSLSREYDDVALVAQSLVAAFSDLLDQDPMQRLVAACSAACRESYVDVDAYTRRELQLIGGDFSDAVQVAADMYARNDFYVKDVHQSLSGALSYIHEKGTCILKQGLQITEDLYSAAKQLLTIFLETFYTDFSQISNFFKDIQELLVNVSEHVVEVVMDLKQLSESLQTYVKYLLTGLRESIAQADRAAERMLIKAKDYVHDLTLMGASSLKPYLVEVQRYTIFLHNSLVAIEHSILEMAQTVVNTIMAVKELEDLANLYEEYSGWLEELQVQEYFDRVLQYLNVVGEILIEDFNRMFAEYKESIDIALSVMSDHVERIDRVPAVAYVKHMIDTIYEKVSWLWRYHNVSKHLEMYLTSILNNLDEIVAQFLHGVDMDPQPSSHARRQLVVRPGYLEISQRLPVEWESFQTWPEFSQFAAPSAPDFNQVGGYHTYMTAALSKLSPNFSEASLLPPFGATAIIAGKQHFITFDNYFYDFVGECSYLLASDFLDNKFSIVVNYEHGDNNNVASRSLTVISEGHRIDISARYQVTVDGKRVELPAVVGGDIVMSRFGSRLIVESEYSMAVECNVVHDICTVQLTGWNFGKTGGLLGTFDNEPSNDVSFPNGTLTTNLARFASSWRVGSISGCLPVNHADAPEADDDAADACDVYFTDLDSPLADCYAGVDPMPFYRMCVSDVARGGDAAGVCTAAVAYATMCSRAGLDATLPQECVQCQLPNSPALSVGESKVLNGGVPLSADVVFVVEQGACVKDVNLAKMATKLDAALVQQGLADNRFSMVGFGGETFPQAHSRTAKGEIWTSGRGMEKAFAGLVLSDGEYSRNEQDVYDALMFASRLTFRGGVSKTVVLVQCSACDVQLDYGDMMGQLLQNDITLHLLQPGVVVLRDSSTRTNGKVFGADLSGVYTARNGKNVKPDASLLKQMVLPKDHCSPLALETNGTAFNLERVSSSSVKRFADVWARRVAQGARPSPCQRCECVADTDGLGRTQCSTCVTASVDQFMLDWQSLLTEDYNQTEAVTVEKSDEDDS